MSDRRRRESRGRRAEWLAAAFLIAKGYRLLARRARTPVGEVDLVMAHGDTLVFVEVKARDSLDSGLMALHPAALARVRQAARWLTPRHIGRRATTRIDAVIVRPWRLPVHLLAL